MNTFTFTDNRGGHKHVLTLSAAQVAEHLAKDEQFMFYFRKGWDPRQAAIRSLHLYPPSLEAPVFPQITEGQWTEIELSLPSPIA